MDTKKCERISVIIPVYNMSKYLETCMESILKQTYPEMEVILVDDGSTDDSGERCDRYAKEYPFVKVIHKKNGGLSSARNAGIKAASGKVFFFVDSDDWVSGDLCSSVMKRMEEEQADLVCYRWQAVRENGETGKTAVPYSRGSVDNAEAMEMLLLGTIYTTTWSMAARRELFHDKWFPEGHVAEDVATGYRLIHRAKKIALSNDILYFYRVGRSGSIIGAQSRSLYRDEIHYGIRRMLFIRKNYPALIGKAMYMVCNYYMLGYEIMGIENDPSEEKICVAFFRKYRKYFVKEKKVPIRFRIWIRLYVLFPHFTMHLYRVYRSLK